MVTQQSKKLLPLAAMERVLKSVGAERVSDKAKEVLKKEVEKIVEGIAESAVRLSKHAGRKTVKEEDITLAYKSYKLEKGIV